MHGLHLTADLDGCDAGQAVMTDPAALRALCVGAVAAVGLQAVGELFHRFPAPGGVADVPGVAGASTGGGVTGVVLLAESHLALHTWPELGAVTLDVYVCNLHGDNSQSAEALMQRLQQGFGARCCTLQRLQRGGGRALPPAVVSC